MATVGQQLLAPESGWKRYDLEPPFVTGAWYPSSTRPDNFTGGSIIYTTAVNNSLTFEFYGDSIRLMVEKDKNYDTNGEIEIDGVKSYFSCYEDVSYKGKVLVFEKTGLGKKKHSVVIRKVSNDTKALNVDSIDILPPILLIIKNPTTSQHYSLDNKTLIHLPNVSDKNMILHGLEAGKEIKLDEAFDRMNYPVDSVDTNADGLLIQEFIKKPLSIKFE